MTVAYRPEEIAPSGKTYGEEVGMIVRQIPNNWICPICQNKNELSDIYCNVCGKLKE